MNIIVIPVKVIPRAKKSEIVGWEGEKLKIRIAAVPDRGAANNELIDFLASHLDIARSQITLLGGSASRHKRIGIRGLTADQLAVKLPPQGGIF